jgi:hypothetical protein
MFNARTRLALAAIVIFTLAPFGAALAQVSPYAGQQTREIKALSAQEVDDLLNARGMAPLHGWRSNSQSGPVQFRPRQRGGPLLRFLT